MDARRTFIRRPLLLTLAIHGNRECRSIYLRHHLHRFPLNDKCQQVTGRCVSEAPTTPIISSCLQSSCRLAS